MLGLKAPTMISKPEFGGDIMKKLLSVYKILALAGGIILCLSGCSFNQNDSGGGENVQKSYREYAEIFNKHGIQGTTTQMLEEMEQQYKELPPEIIFNKAAALLTALGQGDYDFTNMTWIPYENGVFSFDVEVFNEGKMYTDFLAGISSLDKKELDFKNIHEDTSHVNWEEGTGKRTVTFEWKNKEFTLEAKVEYDWFDLNVANELNKIIKKYGNGKQLFFTSDGYQECIVFYRDNEWANRFQQETGLVFSEVN